MRAKYNRGVHPHSSYFKSWNKTSDTPIAHQEPAKSDLLHVEKLRIKLARVQNHPQESRIQISITNKQCNKMIFHYNYPTLGN